MGAASLGAVSLTLVVGGLGEASCLAVGGGLLLLVVVIFVEKLVESFYSMF